MLLAFSFWLMLRLNCHVYFWSSNLWRFCAPSLGQPVIHCSTQSSLFPFVPLWPLHSGKTQQMDVEWANNVYCSWMLNFQCLLYSIEWSINFWDYSNESITTAGQSYLFTVLEESKALCLTLGVIWFIFWPFNSLPKWDPSDILILS